MSLAMPDRLKDRDRTRVRAQVIASTRDDSG